MKTKKKSNMNAFKFCFGILTIAGKNRQKNFTYLYDDWSVCRTLTWHLQSTIVKQANKKNEKKIDISDE